jgi:hypothetical protein
MSNFDQVRHAIKVVAMGATLTVLAACGGGGNNPFASADNANRSTTDSAAGDTTQMAKRSGISSQAAPTALSPDSDPIVEGPKDLSVVVGEPATFSAQLALQAGDVVEWVSIGGESTTAQCASQPVSPTGSTVCVLLAPAALTEDGTRFFVKVSRSSGELVFESRAATMTVTPTRVPMVITSNPASQTVPAGQSAVFKVEAEGSRFEIVWSGWTGTYVSYMPPRVQWFKDGVAITGRAASNELVVPTTAAQAGTQSVITAKLTNPMGTTVSEPVTLSVASASTVIGAAGGNVPGPKGSSLSVPAGAVASNATIAITEEEIPAGAVPPDFVPIGKVLNVTSTAPTFAVPAELTIQGPQYLPPDMALAVVRLDEARALVSVLNKRNSTASGIRAQPAVVPCLNPQNSGINGSVTTPIGTVGQYQGFQVPAANCSSIDPIRAGLIPSPTDTTCLGNADFAEVTGTNSDYEKTLVSRHVDCRRTISSSDPTTIVTQTIDLDVDLLRLTNGTYTVIADPTAVPPGSDVTTFTYGQARLESRVSIYGPSNKLSKDLRYEIRLSRFTRNPAYPAAGIAPQFTNIVFQPDLSCDFHGGGGVNPNCKMKPPEVSVPLVGAAWTRGLAKVEFNWTKGLGQINDTYRFNLSLSKYFYKMPGADYYYYGSLIQKRSVDSRLDVSPFVRCDKGVAQVDRKGCVFDQAAPVYDVRTITPPVPDIEDHIADAQAGRNSPSPTPGKFQMKSGSRAVAADQARPDALQRLKNEPLQDKNRAAACGILSGAIISVRPSVSSACRVNPTSTCNCDEFPFASTWQGAGVFPLNFDRVSARIVNAEQNSRAGSGNLSGKFYLRERVLDLTIYPASGGYSNQAGDEFWVFAK